VASLTLRPDATADCPECHLPMFPVAQERDMVTLECANRHRAIIPGPTAAALRRLVRSWIARRGAQLHTQHERWEDDDD
jgi:hypothetical protein